MTRPSPLDIATDIVKLAQSGLFDTEWYLSTYGHILSDDVEALVHFCNGGWQKGYQPNRLFDTRLYLRMNDDVISLGRNPLVHYLDYGECEHRIPSLHFDAAWYREAYHLPDAVNCLSDYLGRLPADMANPNSGFDSLWYENSHRDALHADISAFADYLSYGMHEGRDFSYESRIIRESGDFDDEFYIQSYPDVALYECPPIYHFCVRGWRQGYNPNRQFNTERYLELYADVRHAKINPFSHFLEYGKNEGRLAPDSTSFLYASDVPDREAMLDHSAGSLSVLSRGSGTDLVPDAISELASAEAIAATELFDVNFYLISYPDVRESGIEPIEHFCRIGWQEGRRPNLYFDPVWYRAQYLDRHIDQNPLLHYILYGEQTSNNPIAYFDTFWYREQYRLMPEVSPLGHFLSNRRSQKFSPTPYFDVERYMSEFGDEIGQGRDPFVHFLRTGISRDVDPSFRFNMNSYRQAHMPMTTERLKPQSGAEIHDNLSRETLNPLVHFLLQSQKGQ